MTTKLPRPVFLTCLWVDIDVGAGKPNKDIEQALRRVRDCGVKPTITVNSGHGLHIYFRLKRPAKVPANEAKKLLRAMTETLGGDLQAAEVARLLRVPGTVN